MRLRAQWKRRTAVAGLLLSGCVPKSEAPPLPPPAPRVTGTPTPARMDAGVTVDAVAPPAPAGAVGTAHPVAVDAVSPLATWTVLCQARNDTNGDGRTEVMVGARGALSGDVLSRYLAQGAEAGSAIDDLAAQDATGRWLVVQRGDALWLVDSFTRRQTQLHDADSRRDSEPFVHHRSVAFDQTGSVLAYLRRGEGRARVVVRQLSTRHERELDPGDGNVWRLDVDPTGHVVVARIVTEDLDGNGRLAWPAGERKQPWPCRGPIATYPSPSAGQDGVTVRALPVDGSAAHDVPGFVAALGATFLTRKDDGALYLADRELAPADCGARVLFADATRKLALVACTGSEGRPPLELVGAGVRVKLDADIAHLDNDHEPSIGQRLVPVYPGASAALVDLRARKLRWLERGDLVAAVQEASALVRRGHRLVVVAADGATKPVPAKLPELPFTVVGLHHAAVTPYLVRVTTGEVMGTFTGKPLAVSPEGRVLLAQVDDDGEHLGMGPLRWTAPRRQSSDAGAAH